MAGFTPNETLANPFPNGKLPPVNSSQGALDSVGPERRGQLSRYVAVDIRSSGAFRYSGSSAGNWLVEAGYMGNRGVHLPGRADIRLLAAAISRRSGTQLQQLVDNPYFGTIPPNLPLGQRQVTRATLLDTYPQFSGAAGYATLADSIYHAATLRVEKRFSSGLSFLLAYTFSKLIDNNQGAAAIAASSKAATKAYATGTISRAERSVSSNDLPQRLVISGSYELPFGKAGPAFIVKHAIGGWQLNAIASFQSGNVIAVSQNGTAFGSSKPNVVGRSVPG